MNQNIKFGKWKKYLESLQMFQEIFTYVHPRGTPNPKTNASKCQRKAGMHIYINAYDAC